jgi:serine protease Do
VFCSKCGNPLIEKTRYCSHCGKKKKKTPLWLLISFVLLVGSGIIFVTFFHKEKPQRLEAQSQNVKMEVIDNKEPIKTKMNVKPVQKRIEKSKVQETSDIIAGAQPKVYTIFTDQAQGSGFLYDEQGDVVTNAHVVEGQVEIIVKDVTGKEHEGTVIGYSNETDVAVVRVSDFIGESPLPIEREAIPIGKEVIALGSPLGLENTATLGYISGTGRNFIIGNRTYENLYQTSAPLSPGSSGGPLLSKESGKAIAINSAKNMQSEAIGFSIPLYEVEQLLGGWIANPLTENEIYTLFMNENGEYYYSDLWSEDDGYFDGGDYSEDEYDDYYDYPSEEPAAEEPSSDYDEPNSSVDGYDEGTSDSGIDYGEPVAPEEDVQDETADVPIEEDPSVNEEDSPDYDDSQSEDATNPSSSNESGEEQTDIAPE